MWHLVDQKLVLIHLLHHHHPSFYQALNCKLPISSQSQSSHPSQIQASSVFLSAPRSAIVQDNQDHHSISIDALIESFQNSSLQDHHVHDIDTLT